MAKIEIKDLFEELSEENNRLLMDLMFSQKCIKFLENYIKCLISFKTNCICDQNIGNKLQLNNELEVEFNRLNESVVNNSNTNEVLNPLLMNDIHIKTQFIDKSMDELNEALINSHIAMAS